MAFADDEVRCEQCDKVHRRRDGVVRLSDNGKDIISYCSEKCFRIRTGDFMTRLAGGPRA